MAERLTTLVFGERITRALPQRVRQQIARQQRDAEILISWLQLALILFFIALYSIAPKTSAGTPFKPVPWVLAVYLLFTLVRLLLTHRRRLPAWFLLASVVVDIGLLMALLWSFHIQYMQPPSFYLKAPTLLYVFLFIALRTLRFDPTYVLAAGAAAVTGWIVLVWYAIAAAPEPVITRDYVRYLTANVVLIGAEVDKIIVIAVVTLVLALAIVRARRLLVRAVTDATVARDLRRFVAPEIASRIAAADRPIQPGDAETKEVSVLFCDIEGFSTIAERLDARAVMTLLNDYFAAVAAIVDREGGVITMYQGDAMLVTFNAARPIADHARAALTCALAMQEMLARETFGVGVRLPTRCGVNTGEMVAGAVGTPDRLYVTVYGDNVNIAARLEALNKSFGTYVLATADTLAAAGPDATARFGARPIGSVPLKGRSEPVAVYAVGPPTATPAASARDRP